MLNVELVFADYGHTTVAQELVVVEQAAGNGILYGHHAEAIVVGLHGIEEPLECITTDGFNLFAGKIFVGGDVVKRPSDALDSSFHVADKNKSRSLS